MRRIIWSRSRSIQQLMVLAPPAASAPPTSTSGDEAERRDAVVGEDHRRNGRDEQQLDHPRLGQEEVRARDVRSPDAPGCARRQHGGRGSDVGHGDSSRGSGSGRPKSSRLAFESPGSGSSLAAVADDRPRPEGDDVKQSIRMTTDRILVRPVGRDRRAEVARRASSSRRPRTSTVASCGRRSSPSDPRCATSRRTTACSSRPSSGHEVEIRGEEYLILRERDVHAVASARGEGQTGLYL